MKVLVIGSGGREQALGQKLSESRRIKKVIIAPGLAGFQNAGKIEYIPIPVNSYIKLLEYSRREQVDFVVVGPDQALADGIVNLFETEKIPIFGPSRKAAQLEASKVFAKEVMKEAKIPTAQFYEFTDINEANLFVQNSPWNKMVIKKDGLALGKGVMVCNSKKQAKDALWTFMIEDNCPKILIEERMEGRELSYFVLSDGNDFITLGHACDYKRIRDNDEGPNTGGMGAYSPVDWIDREIEKTIENRIIEPLLKTMKEKGIPFKGCLFAGIMVTKQGPKVVEFNVRFGDPETQAILPLIEEDFSEMILDAIEGKLSKRKQRDIKKISASCVHLVIASHGYPGTEGQSIRKGDEIKITQEFEKNERLFLSGVKKQNEKLITNGGRVLGLSAIELNRESARIKVYQMVKNINFEGMHYRTDIAR